MTEPLHTEQVILARLINAGTPVTYDALAIAGSHDPEALVAWAVDEGLLAPA